LKEITVDGKYSSINILHIVGSYRSFNLFPIFVASSIYAFYIIIYEKCEGKLREILKEQSLDRENKNTCGSYWLA
jgi:hypothetical protein